MTYINPASGVTDASKSKKDIIHDLLVRPGGCTALEVMVACNWPSVSMPAQARLSKVRLRKEKNGRTYRYYGEPMVPVPVSEPEPEPEAVVEPEAEAEEEQVEEAEQQ